MHARDQAHRYLDFRRWEVRAIPQFGPVVGKRGASKIKGTMLLCRMQKHNIGCICSGYV
jgi:hypothetical protein